LLWNKFEIPSDTQVLVTGLLTGLTAVDIPNQAAIHEFAHHAALVLFSGVILREHLKGRSARTQHIRTPPFRLATFTVPP
jgi:hypothetical protein